MAAFYLKEHDTYPILEVILLNPDGSVHDLTGSVSYFLHIELVDGTAITRPMSKEGVDAEGRLQYAWSAADWAVGGLYPSPYPHRMEYEVVTGSNRMTFPNDRYDELLIRADIA